MDQNQLREERVYPVYSLFSILKVSQGKNSRQELGGRTEVETMEECCLLACFLWWYFAFLYTSGPSV
uniref:Uncharacterized protein n=1 Tax=Trichinella nativa TaxID=6335 RepID=A0A0V1JMN8_9BILA